MIKIGINGFGRIGRAILRAKFKYSDFKNFEIVAINDLSSPEMLAYLFKYDSVFGKLSYKIKIFQEPDPEKISWKEEGMNYVIKATGRFRDGKLARKHLSGGVKRVIISASSCISNSAAPVLNFLMKYYEIEKCYLTSVHAYTNTQRLLDMIHPKDFRRAKAAALNIVPINIDFQTIIKIIPTLRGKIEGICIRVPIPVVSLNDFVILIKEKTTPVEINRLFKKVRMNILNILKNL